MSNSSKKDLVCKLLKGIETGDPEAVAVVNENKYIQHNPLTRTGNVGLAELFKRLSKTNPRVEIIRAFEDGDFVFAHTDYDFNVVEVGFEVFRYEDGYIVEHWDNLQLIAKSPNPSGHSMLDGPTQATELDKTEENRSLIHTFIETVIIPQNWSQLDQYIDSSTYTEHNFELTDGLDALEHELETNPKNRDYQTLHRVLAQGNFVLSVTEGDKDGQHLSFYDLFRIANGKIVEHWDTIDEVPPRTQWVNNNGKF